MKVAITGGAGYLGSVLTRILLQKGHHVRVFDSLLHGGQALLGLYPSNNFTFVKGDIRDIDHFEKFLGESEAVVHLAAIVGDPACARDPELTSQVNLEGALRIYELCRRKGVERFIFASTCSNYGRMADSSILATEESDLSPVSLYAETKVAVERALLDSSSEDTPAVTVLRFATLFGLSPRMRFDLTVNEFTMELLVNRTLEVYGEQFWRPYVHVRDAARAIALTLSTPSKEIGGNVFNVGDTGQNYRKSDLVDMISKQLLDQIKVDYVRREEDPRDYRVSFDKIQHLLGFNITRTVSDGVEEIVQAINNGVITDFDNQDLRN